MPWKPQIPDSCPYSIEALYPYRRYAKLLGERLWCSNYPQPAIEFKSGYFDLPLELRLQVLAMSGVRPDMIIDIWPYAKYGKHGLARKRHRRQYSKSLSTAIRLLRVSKAMHHDVCSTMYAQSEFRITNVNAWMVFNAFLFTIGPDHYEYIQHVTIHAPFTGTYPYTDHNRLVDGSKHATEHLDYHLQCRMDLRPPHASLKPHSRAYRLQSRAWNNPGAFKDVCTVLSKSCHHLKVLRLVLPPEFEVCVHDCSAKAGQSCGCVRLLGCIRNRLSYADLREQYLSYLSCLKSLQKKLPQLKIFLVRLSEEVVSAEEPGIRQDANFLTFPDFVAQRYQRQSDVNGDRTFPFESLGNRAQVILDSIGLDWGIQYANIQADGHYSIELSDPVENGA